MTNQSKQSSDAANQCGNDPVAMALEAFQEIADYCETAECSNAQDVAVRMIAALSSIKDQQAHGAMPVVTDELIQEVKLLKDYFSRCIEGRPEPHWHLIRRQICAVLDAFDETCTAPQAPASLPEVVAWMVHDNGHTYTTGSAEIAGLVSKRGAQVIPLTRCDTKETAQEQGRDITGEDVYLAGYEHEGAMWVANEHQNIWNDWAARLNARLKLKEPHHGK